MAVSLSKGPTAAQIMAMHEAFLGWAAPYYGEPYQSVTFGATAESSGQVRIPNAMLLAKTFLIVSGSATLNVPASSEAGLSKQGLYALIQNVKETVGLSAAPIDVSGFVLAQKTMMDYPAYDDAANQVITGVQLPYTNASTTTAAAENFDFSFVLAAPNVYSEAGLQGLILMQNQKVAGNFTVQWAGESAPVFTAVSGAAPTITNLQATVQFASELYPVPTTPQQGAPDLTRYPILQSQQYPLTNTKTTLNIDPGLEITRVTLHMYGANGLLDAANALGLQTIQWSWNGGASRQMDAIVQVPNFLAQTRYSRDMASQIGQGTYIIDFDRHAPREWFNSANVTDLKLVLGFGVTPAQGSTVTVSLESILDITRPA